MWLIQAVKSFFSWVGRGLVSSTRRLGEWSGLARGAGTPPQRSASAPASPRGQTTAQRRGQPSGSSASAPTSPSQRKRTTQKTIATALVTAATSSPRGQTTTQRREQATTPPAARRFEYPKLTSIKEEEAEKLLQSENIKQFLQKKAYQDKKQKNYKAATGELDSIIAYATGSLAQESKEKDLYELYLALSNLLDSDSSLTIEDKIRTCEPESKNIKEAYNHIADEIYKKSLWRRDIPKDKQPLLLEYLKSSLGILLVKEAKNHLATLFKKALDNDSPQPEIEKVISNILNIDNKLLTENQKEEFLKAIYPKEEEKEKESSWGSPPPKKAQPSSAPPNSSTPPRSDAQRQAELAARLARFDPPSNKGPK